MEAKTLDLWTDPQNPADFFRQRIVAAQERQNLKLTENVEFYLVNLLCNYVRVTESKVTDEECLALLLKRALESSPTEQTVIYKHLADTALYFSGFFQEYFNNKSFSVGYYVSMGESAYGQLASMLRRKSSYEVAMSEIYSELSKAFPKAVDVLMDVSEHTSGQGHNRDIMSLYNAWLDTASVKIEKDLRAKGIHPIAAPKKFIQ